MPMKDNKLPPVCINHPEKRMMLLGGEKTSTSTHVFLLAKSSGDDPIKYSLAGEATAVSVYSCPLCGYCESYLTPYELKQRLDLE